MRKLLLVFAIMRFCNMVEAQDRIRISQECFYYLVVDIGITSQIFLANNQSQIFANLLENKKFYYTGNSTEFDPESKNAHSIYSNNIYNNLELWYDSNKRETILFVSEVDPFLMKSTFEEFIGKKNRLFIDNKKAEGNLAFFVGPNTLIDNTEYFLAFPFIFSDKGGDFIISFMTPVFINEEGHRKTLASISNKKTLTQLLAKSVLLILELRKN